MTTGSTRLCFSIESVGRLTASVNRLYLFGNGPSPAWDSDGVWINCWSGYPSEIAASVDFGEGRSTVGGQNVLVRAGAVNQQGRSVGELLYDQTRVVLAGLDASISTPTQTTINTNNSGLAGQPVAIAREVIRLGTHTGSGVYTGCTRGALGTTATVHDVNDYGALLDATRSPVLRYRRITFCRVHLPTATSYGDLETLWTGVVFGLSAPDPTQILIESDSLFGLLGRIQICRNLFRADRDTTATGNGEQRIYFTGDEAPVRSTQTDLSLDGDIMVTLTPEAPVGGLTRFVARPGDVNPISNGVDWPKDASKATECFHADGDGQVTNALPLAANLITCWLQVLCTTKDGTNGAYDVGVEDLGCGIPVELIDVAGMEDLRGRLGLLLEQDRHVLGFDGKPVDVLSYFQAKLKPYLLVPTDRATRIGLALLADNSTGVTATLSEGAEILGPASTPRRDPPRQMRRLDLSMDSATVDFDFSPGAGVVTNTFVDSERRRINIYGENLGREYDLSGVGNEEQAAVIAAAVIQRFHDDLPQIDLTVKRGSGLDVGDLVLVTHSKIYRPAGGVRSVTNQPMLCVSRALELDNNVVRLTLLDVGALYGRVGLLAPTAVVASWTSGTGTLVVEEDAFVGGGFQSGETAAATEDLSEFSVLDIVDLCDSNGVVRKAGLVIASLNTSTNTIIFAVAPDTGGSPVTPVAGDVLRLSSYDSQVARTKARFVSIADSSGGLGSTPDIGFEYSLV